MTKVFLQPIISTDLKVYHLKYCSVFPHQN